MSDLRQQITDLRQQIAELRRLSEDDLADARRLRERAYQNLRARMTRRERRQESQRRFQI